jgi:type VI secretion system protein ImpK
LHPTIGFAEVGMNTPPKPSAGALPPSALDDPFADALLQGRTFIKPTPGRAASTPATSVSTAASSAPDVAADIDVVESGLNPLVAAANPLLALVPRIRATTQLADGSASASALRESMAQAVRAFEQRARERGVASEPLIAARYVLCTLLDETAASMPWGGAGQWGRHSLLAIFHNETEGGEKVFQLMAKLAQAPAANRDLLELIFTAIALGFEGRYRVIDGGAAQLQSVRERLAQILKKERGDVPKALAEHWRGVLPARRPWLTWAPLGAAACLVALGLTGAFLWMSKRLGDTSDPAYAKIVGLRLGDAQAVARPVAPKPRLAAFLQPEITQGLVSVRDEVDRSVITVRGDGLFQPASAQLSGDRKALMQRIAEASKQVPGQLLVTGHTDNSPIRTARFPSNWHLSQERANTVRDVLVGQGLAAGLVKAEGRADAEPSAPNDSPANRALNRRVVITLLLASKQGG